MPAGAYGSGFELSCRTPFHARRRPPPSLYKRRRKSGDDEGQRFRLGINSVSRDASFAGISGAEDFTGRLLRPIRRGYCLGFLALILRYLSRNTAYHRVEPLFRSFTLRR